MAITGQDGIIAGAQPPVTFAKNVTATLVAGRPTSLFALAGNPGPGSQSSTINGSTYSSSSVVPNGILYHKDPGSGNSYLTRFVAEATIPGTIILADRIWDNQPAVSVTTAQSISSPTWPARDSNGSTNGLGIMLGLEIVAATSSTAATISVSYTNSSGTAGRVGTAIDVPTAAANAIGNFYRIGLAAGDQGVRSVQSITMATDWTSGTLSLVAYRVLAMLELGQAFVPNALNPLTGGFPQLYNGVCPFIIFLPQTTTATLISGCYVETQG